MPSSPVAARTRPVRVAVVDDDAFVLTALRGYLSADERIEVASTFSRAADALAFLGRVPVDVLLTDVRMPGMDGLELLARVRRDHPALAVVVLTSFDDDQAMLTALASQANGFLLKDAAPEEIARAVLAAAEGGTTIAPSTASRLVARHLRPVAVTGHEDLTAAEREVLALLCEGYSNAEIAERLVIAESTVKTHVSSLMRKYAVASRLKLVVAVHREQELRG
ncbi:MULTISPECIES: response regulator transcription factor [unclassified Actinomyces]|uniref:response regulator n=1 Tax=unclassified Actinomyces TaxID=2609248 RepID=UPI00201765B1|nr:MULTISPECIES: response regulator transcription factor [unclassified Actinomyces]MCL3778382.1 response regulator transcription factor [Actinomyces sp. AC-20-1]MCL3790249.1 response regulator transcription factor [Actinomyces sp. 187325]MCL3792516.1 response regulator transcription factor [Actinomyces sp. 186855]MCL3795032.1 response regulator transcription factor [Actinomyces sp. 217892]